MSTNLLLLLCMMRIENLRLFLVNYYQILVTTKALKLLMLATLTKKKTWGLCNGLVRILANLEPNRVCRQSQNFHSKKPVRKIIIFLIASRLE